MMAQMIFHKAGNEIVAVVVALMAPQRERQTAISAGLLEKVRIELAFEELIAEPLIDQDVRPCRRIAKRFNDLGGVIGLSVAS